MFDKEVIDEMRRQFDAADVNGDGELDAGEACFMVAGTCSPNASSEEIQRLADGLRNQVDADRSGTVSFEEYCFRFGRRYQIEANKRRRAGGGSVASTTNACSTAIKEKDSNDGGGRGPAFGDAAGTAAVATASTLGLQPEGSADSNNVCAAAGTTATATDPAEELRREREALQREREALQRERDELHQRQQEDLRREREQLRQRKIDEFAAKSAASGGPAAAASGTTAGSGSSAEATPPRIAPGARVTLHGLRALPELNGRTGRVARFDVASGRFIVWLESGGDEKSIRADNLTLCSSASQSASSPSGPTMGTRLSKLAEHTQAWCMKAAAHVQLWLSGYESWQILLGLGLIVLFVAAWFQVSARYPGPGGKTQASMGHSPSSARSYDSSAYSGSEDSSSSYTNNQGYSNSYGSEYSGSSHTDGDYHGDAEHRRFDDSYGDGSGRGSERPPRRQPGRSPRYDEDIDDDNDGGYSGSGGGLLGSLGQSHGMLVLVVIAVLCWKGIIPVHRMSFFQMYMLWQMLEPLLFGGGRRRSYGYGGYGGMGGGMFGRGRRFF